MNRTPEHIERYVERHVENLTRKVAESLEDEYPLLTRQFALKLAYQAIGRQVAKGLAPKQS